MISNRLLIHRAIFAATTLALGLHVSTPRAHADPSESENVDVRGVVPPAGLSPYQLETFRFAASLLGDCNQLPGQQYCRPIAEQFVREFVNAVAGDYTARKNVADELHSGIVTPKNPDLSCAMRQLMADGHDRRYTHSEASLTETYCFVDGNDITAAGLVKAEYFERFQAQHHIKRISVPTLGFDATKQREEYPPE